MVCCVQYHYVTEFHACDFVTKDFEIKKCIICAGLCILCKLKKHFSVGAMFIVFLLVILHIDLRAREREEH